MNGISIEHSAPTVVSLPRALMRGHITSIEAAINRYASTHPTPAPQQTADTADFGMLIGAAPQKDYAAIARTLLARLDTLRDRAMQWRDGISNAIHSSTSPQADVSPDCRRLSPAWTAPAATTSPPAASSAPAAAASSLTPAPVAGATVTTGRPIAELPFIAGLGLTLNDHSGAAISGTSIDGTDYGIVVDNGQTSENISIDGLSIRNVQRYGMYLGAVRNWNLNNITLEQGAGASEHGLRIAEGEQVTLRNSTIDTTRGHKSSMWLINVNDVLVENTTFSGGAIRLGARPNDNQGSPNATNIVIRDSVINKVTGGDAEAIQVWPGSSRIHLANLDITLETSDNWLSIDSRNVSNITWDNIRVNGRLITGFEGVKLGGLTQTEALARGIGPAIA